MADKTDRKNILIYEEPLILYQKYLVNKQNGANVSMYTWGLIKADMIRNGVSETKINKALKGTPWEDK